jgi:hypothetical protein
MGGCGQFLHAFSGEVRDFHSVSPEYFGRNLVLSNVLRAAHVKILCLWT